MSIISINKIGQVAVPVTDIEQAVQFYRDILGIPFLFQAPPGLAFFDLNGIRLLLDAPAAEFAGSGTIIYYSVPDLGGSYQALSEAGVTVESPPHLVTKMPDHELWMAFIRDPDNNLIGLMNEKRD